MRLTYYFTLSLIIILLISCKSNSSSEPHEKSKELTQKALLLIENTYFLRTQEDTLNYMQSITYLDSAYIYDHSNTYAIWKKSELQCELKQYNQALLLISSYCNKHRDNLDFLLREGYILEKLQNTKAANKRYQFVLEKIDEELKRQENDKTIMTKITLLKLLKDPFENQYCEEILKKYPTNSDLIEFISYFDDFSRDNFIDFQLTGKNKDIIVKK